MLAGVWTGPWGFARLLQVICDSNHLLTSKGWSFSSAEISAQTTSFLCLSWKCPCSLSYSSGCSFINSTIAVSWLSVSVAQTLALLAAEWHSESSSHLLSSLQAFLCLFCTLLCPFLQLSTFFLHLLLPLIHLLLSSLSSFLFPHNSSQYKKVKN